MNLLDSSKWMKKDMKKKERSTKISAYKKKSKLTMKRKVNQKQLIID